MYICIYSSVHKFLALRPRRSVSVTAANNIRGIFKYFFFFLLFKNLCIRFYIQGVSAGGGEGGGCDRCREDFRIQAASIPPLLPIILLIIIKDV